MIKMECVYQNMADYYNSLNVRGQKKQFVRETASALGVAVGTVERWCMMDSVPSDKNKEYLSRVTGISVDNLFKAH